MRRLPSEELEARFWKNVAFNPHDQEACWPWQGTTQRGYGIFRFYDVSGKRSIVRAHRQAYILAHGEITPYAVGRQELDHECHDPRACQLGDGCLHRRCCNPFHMRLVTAKENSSSARMVYWQTQKSSCPSGHAYDMQNTQYRTNGHRVCAECNRQRAARNYRGK